MHRPRARSSLSVDRGMMGYPPSDAEVLGWARLSWIQPDRRKAPHFETGAQLQYHRRSPIFSTRAVEQTDISSTATRFLWLRAANLSTQDVKYFCSRLFRRHGNGVPFNDLGQQCVANGRCDEIIRGSTSKCCDDCGGAAFKVRLMKSVFKWPQEPQLERLIFQTHANEGAVIWKYPLIIHRLLDHPNIW